GIEPVRIGAGLKTGKASNMATSNKVIITCAVTGSIHTPTMSPHLPITPGEIAEAAIGAAEAGAALVRPPPPRPPARRPRPVHPAATRLKHTPHDNPHSLRPRANTWATLTHPAPVLSNTTIVKNAIGPALTSNPPPTSSSKPP